MTRLWIGLTLLATTSLISLTVPAREGNAQMLAFQSASHSADRGTGSRIQADLARQVESWHGIRGCTEPSRARSALKPALARWLGRQVMARPGRKLALWGYHSGDVWTEDRIADGKPACSAGFRKLIAYADFR